MDIQHLASEACQQDWDNLSFKEVYREGFIEGANTVKSELERQVTILREALIGLDEAYCRAGVGLTREERIEDRKRLIDARKAVEDTRS